MSGGTVTYNHSGHNRKQNIFFVGIVQNIYYNKVVTMPIILQQFLEFFGGRCGCLSDLFPNYKELSLLWDDMFSYEDQTAIVKGGKAKSEPFTDNGEPLSGYSAWLSV